MNRQRDRLAQRALWTGWAVGQALWQRRLPFRPASELERRQARRVRDAVAFAYQHVPHYREVMRRLGVTPADFLTAADLGRLPAIERQEVQRDPERFIARALPRERLVQLATDGTSGEPVSVFYDPFSLFQGAAHYQRSEAVALALTGHRLLLRRVFFGSNSGVVARTSTAVRARSMVPVQLRYRDLWLSTADNVADNVRRLCDHAPDVIHGYGSYLDVVLQHIDRSGIRAGLPRVATFTADALSPQTRDMAATELGISVLSEYSAGEAHHIGFECEAHIGLHLNEDICPIRIVDADGAEVPHGEPGEVTISNLVNRGTVLLNYRLGDVARRIDTPCACGRSLAVMSFPEGRTDEWLMTAAGELVHGQEARQLLLADDRHLLGFQITQESEVDMSVAVVLRDGGDREAFRAGVERRFAERLGPGVRTQVHFVDTLPRTSGGKLRTVISHAGVRQPPPAGA